MGLLALASSVFADAVVVNDKPYRLQTVENTTHVWSTTVPGVSGSDAYYYAEFDDAMEVTRDFFDRRLSDSSKTASPNDFFGRMDNFYTLPKLKQIYNDVRPKRSPVFDNRQIATMHFEVDEAGFAAMMKNATERDKKKKIKLDARFTFVNADVFHFSDKVKLSISGNSSRSLGKVSLKVKFKKDAPFYDHPILKLRAEATDPSMMREMLYVDILNAAGVHTSQASWVRVYVNGQPHGFFVMMQDIEEPYIMNTIHQGTITNKTELGSLYQMSQAEAPMVYISDNATDYGEIYDTKFSMNVPKKEKGAKKGAKKDPKEAAERDAMKLERWITFMKDLRDFKSNDADSIANWNKRFELRSFLSAMAVEYLTGAWDLFMRKGHNYLTYFNPVTSRWMFLPTDFDQTFNNGDASPVPESPYTEWVPKGALRPLVTKLIYENEPIKNYFEAILRAITQDVFNSDALYPLIDAYKEQIAGEVEWDMGVDRSNLTGVPFDTTTDDFYQAIEGSIVEGITRKVNGIKPFIKLRAEYVLANIRKRV
ncbi:hypothetical protein DFQ27_005849 [Actinomortierella ambigua]|uniref:Spore coat protein CotH n=1 Tax=Actinomortierella ambigua TaxID=1343610 RepID=A0A9P6U2C7_9FUNG|nr:hypothetical protein DFQ27_005849 [Actinomortierella ambigua]